METIGVGVARHYTDVWLIDYTPTGERFEESLRNAKGDTRRYKTKEAAIKAAKRYGIILKEE